MLKDEALEIQNKLRGVTGRLREATHHTMAFELLHEMGAILGLHLPGVIPDVFQFDNKLSCQCLRLAGFPEEVFEFLREVHIAPKNDARTWESPLPFVVSLSGQPERRGPEDRHQKQFRETLWKNDMRSILVVPIRQPMGRLGQIGWAGTVPSQNLERIAEIASAELLDFGYRFIEFINELDNQRPATVELPYLTRRELDCLKMVANGYHTPGISEKLGISTTTVRHYLDNCRLKMNARSIAHAVAIAAQHGQLGTIEV